MPSSLIQNYLNDKSVDQSKRKYLMDALNSGSVDEGTAEATIIKKYGNKYGEFSQDSFQETSPDISESTQSPPVDQNALKTKLKDTLYGSSKQKAFNDTGNFLGQAGGEVLKGIGNTAKFGGDIFQGAVDLAAPKPKGMPEPFFRYNDATNTLQEGLDTAGNYVQSGAKEAFGRNEEDLSTFLGKLGGQIVGAVAGGGAGAKAAQKGLGAIPGIAKGAEKIAKTLFQNNPLLQSVTKGLPSFLGGSLGSTAGVSVPTQGRLPTGEELLTGLATDSLLTGLFKGLPKATGKLREFRGKAAGLGDDTIEVLKDAKLGPKTLADVKTAKAYMRNKAENLSPLMRVGQDELKPALLNLETQRKNIGKLIENSIKSSKEKDALESVINKFKEGVNNLGGKVTKAGVKFNQYSRISPADADILTNFWKKITPRKPIGMESVQGLAQQAEDILKSKTAPIGKALVPVSQPVSTVFKGVKTDLRDILRNKIQEAGSLFDEYSRNVNTRAFFNKKLGEEGSSANLLSNLFSQGKKDELVPKLIDLSRQTGRDIIGPARSANAATQIVKKATTPTQNPGIIPKVVDLAQKFIFNPQKAAQKIVKSSKPILPDIGKAIQDNVSNALKGLFFFKK